MNKKEIADWWAGQRCMLNGKEAIISGRLNHFATVAALDGSITFQWSWEAVDRIMKGGGNFISEGKP